MKTIKTTITTRTTQLLAPTALSVLLALPAVSQAQYDQSQEMNTYRAVDSAYTLRASDLIGMDVTGARDEEIGEIDDLVMNRTDNQIQAIVSVGGFLGIGDKLVAVPYDQLRISGDGDTLYLDATEESLKAQPEFNYRDGEILGRDIYRGQYSAAQVTSEEMAQDGMTNDGMTQDANTLAGNATAMEATDDADVMDWQKFENNWDAFTASVESKWDELTDDDITMLRDDHQNMASLIADRTGEAIDDVKRELKEMTDKL